MSDYLNYDAHAEHSYRAARIREAIVGRRERDRIRRRRPRRGGVLDPTSWAR
ncbi:hypothetical protein [Nocardioides insulae]|uniref:hypothetical protein n=1 Tax=Nocardioides insulae TaxID=394734 RepID=UPI00040993D9|nr:hypothetical protein [Nocardioides insulae]